MTYQPQNSEPQASEKKERNWLIRSLLITLAMFGFGYALVPLYDVFCQITGLGGRTSTDLTPEPAAIVVDKSREITLEFTANSITTLPWTFRPLEHAVTLYPGERFTVEYEVVNNAGYDTVGRAVPSVVPSLMGKYLKKTECFCFDFQPVAAKERVLMPVVFYIDPDIPHEVEEMTLSYTFFDASDYAPKNELENGLTQVQ